MNTTDNKTDTSPMNFVVPEKFKRDYKAFSAIKGMSMVSLLMDSFYEYMKNDKNRSKEENSSAEGGN